MYMMWTSYLPITPYQTSSFGSNSPIVIKSLSKEHLHTVILMLLINHKNYTKRSAGFYITHQCRTLKRGISFALALRVRVTCMLLRIIKFTLLQASWPWRGGRGIALPILNLGTRRGWVVSTTPPPFYPRERPGTHCTGGWVGPTAGP
jgi:hypothetical protein